MKKLLLILAVLLALVSIVNSQLTQNENNSEDIPISDNTTPIVNLENETQPQDTPESQAISQFSQALKSNSRKILAGIVALIILIIIVKIAKRSPSPERLYRKAESLHKEAKEFHDDGDDETAQELYGKAEELRDKARGLESSEV